MRLVLSAGLAASLFALGACSGNAPAPEASASAAAAKGGEGGAKAADPLAPENAPTVSVLDPVLKLPAVPGSPGVLYFTIQQESGEPNTLAAVHVDGVGRAEMHESKTEGGISTMAPVQTVTFSKGKPAEFKPGGYHVMLFDVASTLKAGNEAEVTFTLANGDKVSTFATIEAAGGDMGGMGHM
ncbi:MAG: copper chaperone PCu(A)C [Novosphingobium sp.]